MTGPVLGFDVGGANLKAARIDASGGLRVLERPFALWREREALPRLLAEALGHLGGAPHAAITLTAEVADCFATKREGVLFVLDAFDTVLPETGKKVWAADGSFHETGWARRHSHRVASANWLASAMLAAESAPDCLFIDVGSTTADVVPIVSGRVAARGRSDLARLRSGELVYTGALRTPICALVRSVPVRGRKCRVAAELFAIAADAHLYLGHIGESDYTCETPDGRGRTRHESAARLARMVCADLEILTDHEIREIAEHAVRSQVSQISAGISQVLRRLGSSSPSIALLAGHGAFLGRMAAQVAGLEPCEFSRHFGSAASHAAPAAAVASLLRRFLA